MSTNKKDVKLFLNWGILAMCYMIKNIEDDEYWKYIIDRLIKLENKVWDITK